MGARQHADLGGHRADFVRAAAVHALLPVQQEAADHLFLCAEQALVDLGGPVGGFGVEFFVRAAADGLQLRVAGPFVAGAERRADVVRRVLLHGLRQLLVRLGALVGKLLPADFRLNLLEELDDGPVGLEPFEDAGVHHVVRDLVGAGLKHHDALPRGGDGQGHLRFFPLLLGRVDHEPAVHKTHGDPRNRPVPRHVRKAQRGGGAHQSGDLRQAVGVRAHHGADDGDAVAQVLRKQRADGAVDHAAGGDGLFGRPALPPEIGARDSADGVQLLLIIDGKRKKARVFARPGRGGHRDVHRGVPAAHQALPVGELRPLPRFHRQGPAAEIGLVDPVIFKHFSPPCAAVQIGSAAASPDGKTGVPGLAGAPALLRNPRPPRPGRAAENKRQAGTSPSRLLATNHLRIPSFLIRAR